MRPLIADEAAIQRAAEAIQEGLLVGMPTETVYGIAADATNVHAVRATFVLKGRPSENPLIVHVADVEQALEVVSEFPDPARVLAQRFWPGPLTMVLPKSARTPDEVTAGLDTVAVRMPSHPVARSLIQLSGRPLSAPSANRFMALSPTTAQMISPEIAEGLALILDGGPCEVGIESTVVSVESDEVAVLRPGIISAVQISDALGRPLHTGAPQPHASPGMYRRHYAPSTRIVLVERLLPGQPGLTLRTPSEGQIQMPDQPEAYARRLYAALGELDALGLREAFVEAPPTGPEWDAVWDRLTKASSEG